jgi:hypothetical protein
VIAAIHLQFPDSGIIQRLQVIHCQEAQQFLHGWHDLLQDAEDEYDADVHISSTFNEANTQNAFLALSARMKSMEDTTRAQLAKITRCTEQLSPKKQHLPMAYPPAAPITANSLPSQYLTTTTADGLSISAMPLATSSGTYIRGAWPILSFQLPTKH